MRTTIDLPEELLRQAKAHAALRGIRLKDFVTESVRAALEGSPLQGRGASLESGPAGPTQALSEDCVFPLIRGACGPALRDLTPDTIHRILEDDDVAREMDSRRR